MILENINSKHVSLVPILIIDEEPELTTDIEFNDKISKDCITKILTKFAKGYKIRTIIALSCSSIGCLALIFPQCILKCGIVPISIIFLFAFISSLLTLVLLMKVILRKNKLNYKELVYDCLGEKTGNIFNGFDFLYHFMCFCLYHLIHHRLICNLIIGFNYHFHFQEKIVFTHSLRFAISTFQGILYLSLIRFKQLFEFSLFNLIMAIVLLVFFLSMIITFPFKNWTNNNFEIIYFVLDFKNYAYSYGIFASLFGIHYNLFENLSQLMLRTSKRASSVLIWSQSIRSFIFFIFMIIGFFISLIEKDYQVLNLGGVKLFSLVLKIIMVFILFLLIPPKLNLAIERVFSIKKSKIEKQDVIPFYGYILIALLFLIISALTINFLRNILIFTSFMGGACSSILFYYIPVKAYSKVFVERRFIYYISYVIMIPNFIMGFLLSIICIFSIKNEIPVV